MILGPKPTNPIVNRSHPLARGLLACYPMHGGSQGLFLDVSGRQRHGAQTTAPTPVLSTAGQAYSFGAAKVDLPALGLSGSDPFSIAFWTNPATSVALEVWVSFNGCELVRNAPVAGDLAFYDVGITSITTFPAAGVDSLIVFTSDGAGTICAYVNGARTAISKATSVSDANYAIGYDRPQNLYLYSGMVHEVRFYRGALSPSDVRELLSDPWGIYAVPRRIRTNSVAGGGGGGFQAAWAANSNVLLMPGYQAA